MIDHSDEPTGYRVRLRTSDGRWLAVNQDTGDVQVFNDKEAAHNWATTRNIALQPSRESKAEYMERKYQEHLEREGTKPWNDHPDGCWWCGSASHHSTSCPNRTPDDHWYQP